MLAIFSTVLYLLMSVSEQPRTVKETTWSVKRRNNAPGTNLVPILDVGKDRKLYHFTWCHIKTLSYSYRVIFWSLGPLTKWKWADMRLTSHSHAKWKACSPKERYKIGEISNPIRIYLTISADSMNNVKKKHLHTLPCNTAVSSYNGSVTGWEVCLVTWFIDL